MNYKFIVRTLSFLLIGLSISMLPSIGVAWYFNEIPNLKLFVTSFLTGFLLGLIGILFGKINPTSYINVRSALIVVVACWTLFSILGALPYWLSLEIPFTHAVFETASGFTTTGASIFTDVESLPKSILFWRSTTQWIGGMGIIVLSIAILPLLGSSGTTLYKAEVPGPFSDKLMPRLESTAKILWVTYLLLTIASIVCYKIFGMEWF